MFMYVQRYVYLSLYSHLPRRYTAKSQNGEKGFV